MLVGLFGGRKIFILFDTLPGHMYQTAVHFMRGTSATFHAYLSDFPSTLSYVAIKVYVFEQIGIRTPTLVMQSGCIQETSRRLWYVVRSYFGPYLCAV